MKKILILIFSMTLCLMITACSSTPASSTSASDMVPKTPTSTPANNPEDTTTGTPAEPDTSAGQLDDMYNAYSDALENLTKNNILPDGTDAAELSGDMAQNKFALYDVDNDGKEELILMYTNTYMAGEAGYVFAYDSETKKLKTELSEFPMLTFYDNGIIKAGWSHNQGLAGDNFWPYSLYQYVPETDSYELVGMVDAWDKSFSGTDYQNNSFPSDIDKSGTGFVYYIMEDGKYDTTHPVDASEYNAWVSTYIGNASEIEIQYMDLTEENILQIRN
ncbi:MAG: hypothetical protein VB112_01345 [Oscillospiraceae bacterium]|nr:hypothetical protein [Oscillospiraceae bacterium]